MDSGGLMRRVKVFVDGDHVGSLRPRQSLELEVGTGSNTVLGRIDWCSSRPLLLRLESGDTATLQVTLQFSGVWKAFTRSRDEVVDLVRL